MSQQEVYNFLKKNKTKWFHTSEIKKKLKVESASDNLRKLFKNKEVLRKTGQTKQGYLTYLWKLKK